MSNTNIEQMKKLIEEKKKKSTQQGKAGSTTSKTNSGPVAAQLDPRHD